MSHPGSVAENEDVAASAGGKGHDSKKMGWIFVATILLCVAGGVVAVFVWPAPLPHFAAIGRFFVGMAVIALVVLLLLPFAFIFDYRNPKGPWRRRR